MEEITSQDSGIKIETFDSSFYFPPKQWMCINEFAPQVQIKRIESIVERVLVTISILIDKLINKVKETPGCFSNVVNL